MTSSPLTDFGTFARTDDAYVVSILSKRTYRWNEEGRVRLADEQLPLALDIEHAEREDRNGQIVVQGRDVWPLKAATDVIVTGHAHADRAVTELAIAVSVGERERRIVALGQRYVEYRGPGNLWFSAPEPFSTLEVSFWNAYGGIDPMVLPRGLDDTPAFAGKPTVELFPGAYPRNPSGCGYLIEPTPDLLNGLMLPTLEDPAQRLTPDNIVSRDARQWWRLPLPAAFGYCSALWFPRVVHCGGRPYHLPDGAHADSVPEVQLGGLNAQALTDPEARYPNSRMTQEAAPHMIMPFLRGDELVKLVGFSPRGEQRFGLPAERPQVALQVDGKAIDPMASCLHTLAIDADRRTLTLVHSTRFRASTALAEDLSDQPDLDQVVARCEATVDGRRLEREQWPVASDPRDL
jgi:hypothetical protein